MLSIAYPTTKTYALERRKRQHQVFFRHMQSHSLSRSRLPVQTVVSVVSYFKMHYSNDCRQNFRLLFTKIFSFEVKYLFSCVRCHCFWPLLSLNLLKEYHSCCKSRNCKCNFCKSLCCSPRRIHITDAWTTSSLSQMLWHSYGNMN